MSSLDTSKIKEKKEEISVLMKENDINKKEEIKPIKKKFNYNEIKNELQYNMAEKPKSLWDYLYSV